MNILFPGGHKKAFTLSYDDGIEQDKRFVEILNRYKIKGTFNVSAGLLDETNPWVTNNIPVPRLQSTEVASVYEGHEVATHGYTHPNFCSLTDDDLRQEILESKNRLESLAQYSIRGLAYPFGGHDERVISIIQSLGIEYGRTVESSYNFALPHDYYRWNPTCHHNDKDLMTLTKDFVCDNASELSLFYLWGHSFEFDVDNNWNHIEEFIKYISRRDDIWYATNIEIVDYLNTIHVEKE